MFPVTVHTIVTSMNFNISIYNFKERLKFNIVAIGKVKNWNILAIAKRGEIWDTGAQAEHTVKPVFKTTWEIGTTWELRTATSVPRSIQHIEMDLGNKTTSEFRTVLDSPLGVPNSQAPLYCDTFARVMFKVILGHSVHFYLKIACNLKRLAVEQPNWNLGHNDTSETYMTRRISNL